MKSKLTITIASILSVLVLVGVGFAAWVITNPSVQAEKGGTITAETVSDKSYTLTATIANEAIVFGAPAEMKNDKAWLTAEAETQKEDLTATLTLTLTYKDWRVIPANFSVTMVTKKGEATDDTFASLRDGKYSTLTGTLANQNFIANPKITYRASGAATDTTDNVIMNGENAVQIAKTAFTGYDEKAAGTATLAITINFGWGDYFKVGENNVNPYTFYNEKKYEEFGAEANTVLTAISQLKDVNYVVTISGVTNVSGK